jgi:RHS repeat-associated protein
MQNLKIVGLFYLSGMVLGSYAQHAVQYQWSFPEGNLIGNWSFEQNAQETCASGTSSANTTSNCNFKMAGAPSGDYVMRVIPGGTPANGHKSDYLAVEPSKTYTLSVWVSANWVSATPGNVPRIEFFDGLKVSLTAQNLTSYETNLGIASNVWRQYLGSFTTGAEAAFIRVTLLYGTGAANAGNTFYFDNFILTAGSADPSYLESRSYSDAQGAVDQSVNGDETQEAFSFTNYDSERRPVTHSLPLISPKGILTYLSTITIGTRLASEPLVMDYALLQDAYEAIRNFASGRPASSLGAVILNVIGDVDGQTAPLSALPSSLLPVYDITGLNVPVKIQTVFRGTEYYDFLVVARANMPPLSKKYIPSQYNNSSYQAQYPGEANFVQETKYPIAGTNTITESALPGMNFSMGSGHTDKSGWATTANLNYPSGSPELGNPGISGEAAYHYAWSRDRQGHYSIRYTNPEGRVVLEAEKKAAAWVSTEYFYDDFGRPTQVFLPAGSMMETGQYEGAGEVTQTWDGDRGNTQFAYDDKGQLRFVHPEEGGAFTSMIVHKYDNARRPIESGKAAYDWNNAAGLQNAGGFPTQALETGTFYDDLSPAQWQVKTGHSLTTMGLNVSWLKNTAGKVVARYNTNPDYTAPGGYSSPDKRLVASFFSYDGKGRTTDIYKYNGALSLINPTEKLQRIQYVYDAMGRVSNKIVYKHATSSTVVSESEFLYDENGRVAYVVDKDGNIAAAYVYNGLGQMIQVGVYNKFQVRFEYGIQGHVKKIEAVTLSGPTEYIFSELLSRDRKAVEQSSFPAPSHPRYDGRIASVLRKYSKAITSNPVEITQYDYDELGRMTQANLQKSSNDVLNPDGSINYGGLAWGGGAKNEVFVYDDEGTIQQKTDDLGVSHSYQYRFEGFQDTHKLKNVTGARRSGQSMTHASDNFIYDARGRMTLDRGLNRTSVYGFFHNRPVRFVMGSTVYHILYDENLNRVAVVDEVSGSVLGGKAYVYESGQDAVREYVNRSSGHPLGPVNLVRSNQWGVGGMLGSENESTGERKIFVKDHQGSTVKVVDGVSGSYLTEEEYAYWSYGILEKRYTTSSGFKPTGTYTGKEFEDALKLYYFGSRFYDPELGIFLTPDPRGQYFNPYVYGPGDPLNGIDQDGEFWNFIVGAAIGGTIGYITHGVSTGDWTSEDALKAAAAGALAGAITGGIGSLGTGLATNVAYGTMGSLTSYTFNTVIFNDGNFTAGGIAGAALGGALGGALPGVNAVEGGVFKNVSHELAYSAGKGALVGGLSGGFGAAFDGRSIKNGAVQGAWQGAVSGSLGAGLKIMVGGSTRVPTPEEARRVQNMRKATGHSDDRYTNVIRRGGISKWPIFNPKEDAGQQVSRNTIIYNEDGSNTAVHESRHFDQQIESGPIQHYIRGLYELNKYGDYNPSNPQGPSVYTTPGTLEYDASQAEKQY